MIDMAGPMGRINPPPNCPVRPKPHDCPCANADLCPLDKGDEPTEK